MDGNALEVQQMQPLFEEHPWLIDHAWSEVEAQTTYTEQLRKHCKEPRDLPEEDRRMDILGIRIAGELTVVEIKRPKKTESKRDLRQIADYVDWARTHLLGTGPDSPRAVRGLLIVGKLNKQKDVAEERRRLGGDDIRVERYEDLHHRAKEYYELVERTLEKVAPEYARKRRKAAKKTK
jgi:hypothetical protein